MPVRAKFKCVSVISKEQGKEVELSAVHSNTGENKDFTDVTPYGNFKMGISKDARAGEYFEPGSEYYFDITKVEKVGNTL